MPRSETTNDWRLFGAELRVSRAYLAALSETDLLSSDEAEKLKKALEQVESERKAYTLAGLDMFRVLDTRLLSLAGGSAAKLSVGRSPQERLLTALRLWLIDEMRVMGEKIASVQKALLQQAETHVAAIMPAYVNLRPAQPVSAAHWLLSFFWMLTRDQDRLAACVGRASTSPLGSGYLSGSALAIDRLGLARALELSEVSRNSLDAVSDWDFAAEFLFVANLVAIHLSRLAEDLAIFSSPSPGFLSFEGDVGMLSVMRGQTSQLFGQLSGFLATLKALPSVINQDVPQNRQMIYIGADGLTDLLDAAAQTLSAMTIQTDRMVDALDDSLFGADLIDYLTVRGQIGADLIVRRLQAKADQTNQPISEMNLSALQAESKFFGDDVFVIFDSQRSVARRMATGGTAPSAIREQLRRAGAWLIEAGFD